MIKLGQIIRSPTEITIDPKTHRGSIDRDFFNKSMKRLGPIKMRMGWTTEDWFANTYSIVFEARGVRIPRFMNPVRGRRRGKTKTL